MTMKLNDREAAPGRYVKESRPVPRQKVLLYALRRELNERPVGDLDCATVRRLATEFVRATKLDY